MIKTTYLILLAVIAGVAVVAVAVYSSGILSNNNNDEIDENSNRVTFNTIESGFKVIYEGKEIKAGVPVGVPKSTTKITMEVYTPNGSYQLRYWPDHEPDDRITATGTGAAGTWYEVDVYLFGECDYRATVGSYSP